MTTTETGKNRHFLINSSSMIIMSGKENGPRAAPSTDSGDDRMYRGSRADAPDAP